MFQATTLSKMSPESWRSAAMATDAEHGDEDAPGLVFVHETWTKTQDPKTNMVPLRGWAPIGQGIKCKFRTATGKQ